MTKFIWDTTARDWVPAERYRAPAPKGPMVIPDACEIKSMADGKVYTSKRSYYADIRARGYEIVGNEPPTKRGYEPNDAAIDAVVSSVMRGE